MRAARTRVMTFHLSEAEMAELEEAALLRRVTKSAAVRQAIRVYAAEAFEEARRLGQRVKPELEAAG